MATLTPNKDQEVTIQNLGVTKLSSNSAAWGATGVLAFDFAVPVGKKWSLKGVRHGAGGAVMSSLSIDIRIGSSPLTIQSGTSSATTLLANDIILAYGDVVRFTANVTTDGTTGKFILYEEMDA